MLYRLLATACLLCLPVWSALIPADRLTPWTPSVYTGVPGGIPTRISTINVTQPPYNADPTGVIDATSAIQAAVNAAVSHQVVLLPAGTYRLNGNILGKSYVTISGAGIDSTFIDWRAAFGNAFQLGNDSDFAWNNPNSPVFSGYTKGSSNLVFTGALTSYSNKLCFIKPYNDFDLPVISTYGYQSVRRQMARITSVASSNVTIWPPLVWNISATNSPRYAVGSIACSFGGIENMTINQTNSASIRAAVWISQGFGCWVKNVKTRYSQNYGINVVDSVQCEVTGCWMDKQKGGGSNHAGLLFASSTGCLVYDNIVDAIFPDFEINFAACANVFAYNFVMANDFYGAINMNHGPHNHYNLYEGNVTFSMEPDGYYGSSSEDTIFRNWIHGIYTGGGASGQFSGFPLVKLNRFTRNNSVIGNIFGTDVGTLTAVGDVSMGKPNIGNEQWDEASAYAPPWTSTIRSNSSVTISQSGTAVTATGSIFLSGDVGSLLLDVDTSRVYTIASYGSATSVAVGESDTYSAHQWRIAPGPAGWQQIDTNVAASTIFKANYYFPVTGPAQPQYVDPIANPTSPNSSLGGDTVPDSLYLSSTPNWWTVGLQWPPVRTNSPPSGPLASNQIIPAMLRYFQTPVVPTNDPPIIIGGRVTVRGGVNLSVQH